MLMRGKCGILINGSRHVVYQIIKFFTNASCITVKIILFFSLIHDAGSIKPFMENSMECHK